MNKFLFRTENGEFLSQKQNEEHGSKTELETDIKKCMRIY